MFFAIKNCLFLQSLQDTIGHIFFTKNQSLFFFIYCVETFGERDTENGAATAVTEPERKQFNLILPDVWLHIPMVKNPKSYLS